METWGRMGAWTNIPSLDVPLGFIRTFKDEQTHSSKPLPIGAYRLSKV